MYTVCGNSFFSSFLSAKKKNVKERRHDSNRFSQLNLDSYEWRLQKFSIKQIDERHIEQFSNDC